MKSGARRMMDWMSRRTISAVAFSALALALGCAETTGTVGPANAVVAEALAAQACGLPALKAAPDVNAALRVSRSEQARYDVLNDEPTGELLYLGATGFVTQPMRAVAQTPNCPLAGAVTMRRPEGSADARFNKDCCPPGLRFSRADSTAIEGTPTKGGRYVGTVLLCGQCRNGNSYNWYPIAGRIEWIIKGSAPKKVE